jgi:hypothetical protein
VYAVHPADWENIMAGPKTDLQAWLALVGCSSAAKIHGGLANSDWRDEPRQINQ